MSKRLFVAASALLAVAAIVFAFSSWRGGRFRASRFYAPTAVSCLWQAVRFVGANASHVPTATARPSLMMRVRILRMKVCLWASGKASEDGHRPTLRAKAVSAPPPSGTKLLLFFCRTIAEAARHGLN